MPYHSTTKVIENGVVQTGLKFDGAKPDLSLIPYSALEGMARAFMVGEKKYGRDNFKAGMASHRYVAAALRHILAWNNGESLDPETGNHHMWHALASIAMMLECETLGTLEDTRYVKPEPPRV
jgi:hypothetical protein